MKKLLPQANTLATVIRTFKLIANMNGCTLNDIANFNQFELRQASYYSNACYFLDLIDKDLNLTSMGKDIMKDPQKAKIRVYEIIMRHEIIGKIFAKTALYSKSIALEESKKLLELEFPEYGEAVIDRRTRCLIGWCEEILEYMKSS